MQLVLLFECNKVAQTDYKYVRVFLDAYFDIKTIKLTPIFCDSKTKIISDKQKDKIEKFKKDYAKSGETVVIVFADVDKRTDSSNNALIKFCKDNGYYLVWFNRDVEEVMLGKQLKDKDKVAAANKFYLANNPNSVPEKRLNNSNAYNEVNNSNMLLVFKDIKEK